MITRKDLNSVASTCHLCGFLLTVDEMGCPICRKCFDEFRDNGDLDSMAQWSIARMEFDELWIVDKRKVKQ